MEAKNGKEGNERHKQEENVLEIFMRHGTKINKNFKRWKLTLTKSSNFWKTLNF